MTTDVQDKPTTEHISDPGVVEAVNRAIAPDTPTMEVPPNPKVDLMIGVEIDGVQVKTATVRELNGEDEELMAAYELDGNDDSVKLFGFLLRRAVTHLGEHSTEGKDWVDDLTLGDRDRLFLGAIKATYGNERVFNITCPHPGCEAKLDVLIDLDNEFTETPMPPEMRSDGVIVLPLLKGRQAHLRLPTGRMQERSSKDGATVAETMTALIAECLIEITGGLPMHGSKLDIARHLNIPDRQTIVRFLSEKRPGPAINNVTVPCEQCARDIVVRMDWGSLLYP